ncbi:MAG: asparagine--tRNA ligase [Bradymonadia bacterium]
MSHRPIKDLLSGVVDLDAQVTVRGWIRTRRDSKAGLSFLQVHDGSCFAAIQVIADQTLANYADEIQRLSAGCSVEVTGRLAASQGKGQAVEVIAESVCIVGWVENPETYPLQPKRHTMEHLRSVAHLRPRSNLIGAVTRVRHCLSQAIHRFFHERDFYWIHTPIVTGADCEGAGEQFRVSTLDLANLPRTADGQIDFSQDYFGRETHLTVSGQLNVEAYCLALSNVYTFGPTFRAENSNTRRHLSEFWMVEPEIAFADLNDDADLAEAFLKYIFAALLEERADDLEFFEKRVDKGCIQRLRSLVDSDFARIDYTDAIRVLESAPVKFEFPVSWGMDLQAEHERYLAETHVGAPVSVLNYPKDIKAFYMRLNDDGRTVAAMDVLAPGIGEIIGGSQREERLEVLDERIKNMGMPLDDYWWYRDLRKYGTVPHAGFGLGFERAIQYATGVDNIRDVIPFPRSPRNADF